MKRVLLLGSGFTAGSLVETLTRDGTVSVTIASRNLSAAQKIASFAKNTTSILVNFTEEGSLDTLIPGHDLVISLAPDYLTLLVAKQCVNHKVNLVVSTYLTPELQELHQPACDAGVVLMNEIGLDPGIDHMLAMKCIDEVHSKGGKISSFVSYCGGLPAPECSDNPLKYKFSWNPKSSLIAISRGGKFFRDGKVVEYQKGGELMEQVEPILLYPNIDLVGFANRDSVIYREIYGIQEVHTCIRGTLRYLGFSSVALALLRLGVLSDVSYNRLQPGAPSLTWRELIAMLISSEVTEANLIRSTVYEFLGKDDSLLKAVEDLRLLSGDSVELCGTPLNALSSHFMKVLRLQPGERDVIFLHHTIGIEWPNQKEERHIDLTLYGTPHGFTAMSQTVGIPIAIAAQMILTGEICKKGIVVPTTSDIYEPILEQLKKEGIQATVESKYI